MASKKQLKILKQGVEVWNKWRRENRGIRIDLHRANLSDAFLRGVDLRGANLIRADLSNADLMSAKLSDADLSGADLSIANLNGAKLDNAVIGYTTFGNNDLSIVKGLDTANHRGPSTIGINTIYLSKGNIPESFLRGAGVPESFIQNMHYFLEDLKAIQFYSCFIAHSSKDKMFCKRLFADLQAKGVRVWYFPVSAKLGKTIYGEIDRAIRIYDKLIIVCSENSLTSPAVIREIERALQEEDEAVRQGNKKRKHILFPIRLDDYLFDEWEHERKADVVKVIAGNFRGWDKDASKYDAAFKKLMDALEAED